MDFNDTENIFQKFRTHPFRTSFLVILFILFLGIIGYVQGFFGAKGKLHATAPNFSTDNATSLKQKSVEVKKPNKPSSSSKSKPPNKGDQSSTGDPNQTMIIQAPTGDQSPAVNVGPNGESIINYGTINDKKDVVR